MKNNYDNFRSLTDEEINRLESQLCSASDWKDVRVAERFTPDYVHHARFPEGVSGSI